MPEARGLVEADAPAAFSVPVAKSPQSRCGRIIRRRTRARTTAPMRRRLMRSPSRTLRIPRSGISSGSVGACSRSASRRSKRSVSDSPPSASVYPAASPGPVTCRVFTAPTEQPSDLGSLGDAEVGVEPQEATAARCRDGSACTISQVVSIDVGSSVPASGTESVDRSRRRQARRHSDAFSVDDDASYVAQRGARRER